MPLKSVMDDINKLVKSLKNVVFWKKIIERIRPEVEKQKGGFFSMLLGTSGSCLIGNLWTGKKVKAEILVRGLKRACEGRIRGL